jgi:hypothetical protein
VNQHNPDGVGRAIGARFHDGHRTGGKGRTFTVHGATLSIETSKLKK